MASTIVTVLLAILGTKIYAQSAKMLYFTLAPLCQDANNAELIKVLPYLMACVTNARVIF